MTPVDNLMKRLEKEMGKEKVTREKRFEENEEKFTGSVKQVLTAA